MKEVIQKRWLWRRDQTHKFRSIFTRFGRSRYISRQTDDRINMTEGRHSNKKLSVLEFCVSSCLDWQRSLMSTSWMTECVYVNMAKRTMLASVAMTDNFLSRLPDDLWTHGGSWTVIGRVRTSSVFRQRSVRIYAAVIWYRRVWSRSSRPEQNKLRSRSEPVLDYSVCSGLISDPAMFCLWLRSGKQERTAQVPSLHVSGVGRIWSGLFAACNCSSQLSDIIIVDPPDIWLCHQSPRHVMQVLRDRKALNGILEVSLAEARSGNTISFSDTMINVN